MGWSWSDVTDVFKADDGEVSYWKITAGLAACVSPVPVAAVIGVHQFFSGREKKAERRGEQRGEAKAKAEYQIRLEKLGALLEAEINKRHESARYFDLIVALHAVGMACAACDGEVSPEERQDIDEFIGGIAMCALPAAVREKLDFLTINPPNLATAFELVKKYGLDALDLFDSVIELIIYSDGRVAPEEMHFRDEWNRLKNAA